MATGTFTTDETLGIQSLLRGAGGGGGGGIQSLLTPPPTTTKPPTKRPPTKRPPTTTAPNVFAPPPTPTATGEETTNLITAKSTPPPNDIYPALFKKVMEVVQDDMPEPPPGITPQTHYISNDPDDPYYWATLGLADASWAGLPYEYGWVNEDGSWTQSRDMLSVAQQLHDLQNMPIPERPGLIDLETSAPYAGIQSLIDLWNDPNTPFADRQAALDQFASEMGMTADEVSNMLGGMLGQANQGVQAQQGLTPEYTDAYNRETALELQQQQNNYMQMLEAMSAGGRNVAGFRAMDEVARSMSTFQLQRDVTRMNLDMATKQSEYDALMGRWDQLYKQKEMTTQELVDNIQENRMNALTGYAQEISVLVQQNQLTLQAYQSDLAATQLHAETVYKGIMADMGVSESMMSQMQDEYEMYMAPYYAELDRYAIEAQIAMQKQANNMQAIGTVVGAAGTGALIGGAIGGPLAPVGALIGGAIGAVGGLIAVLGSGSLICTELLRQGLMDYEVYRVDCRYGMYVMMDHPDVYWGYVTIAAPIVKLMKQSRFFTLIVKLFVDQWSKEMLFQMKVSKKRSLMGRLITSIGAKISAYVGRNCYGKMVRG